jgi:hypothetical protein
MKYIVNELPKHPTKRYGKRRLDQIKYIVVHHFAGDITIEQAARYHVSKGWPGIGYWGVVDGLQTYVTNDLDTISYGVANNNTRCLSIAVRGNFEDKLPDWKTLEELQSTIYFLHGILGPLPVKVHSDFVATACPGNELYKWVKNTYPAPEELYAIPFSKIKAFFNRLFGRDRDHPELI